MKIWLEKKRFDLKVNWKLSRNQTTFKENFIVNLESDIGLFRSEIAPNVRYGETPDNIQTEFDSWYSKGDLESISVKFHSLQFGLESVLLNYYAAKDGMDLSSYLNLMPPVPVKTSFSMPILPINEIKDYLAPIKRFHSLKIKVDAESGADMINEIKKHTQVKLRVDANEGWKDLDSFMRFQEGLKGVNVELIEQPFPSSMSAEYKELKKRTPYKLLADESIEEVGNFTELSQQFHAVNIKLMKTGSLLKARELIFQAKHHKMEVMMGCMIESTIGISYGMLFAGMVDYVDLDGFLLIKDEPFRLVEETEGILNLTSN